MVDVSHKRDLYNGFGDAMARAIEFAGAPVLFALAGRWVDGRFGTGPLFLLVFMLFAVAGVGARTYYQYKARMDALDAQAPWSRREA